MKRFALAAVILVGLAPAGIGSARADMTETMAYTFALTLGGTVAGAYLVPYVAPAAAPTVSAAYTATALAVDGVLAPILASPPSLGAVYATTSGALNGALTTAGSYVVLEPRMIGAITGMATGLFGGLYLFSDPVEVVDTASKETSNTVVTLRR